MAHQKNRRWKVLKSRSLKMISHKTITGIKKILQFLLRNKIFHNKITKIQIHNKI